MKILIFGNYKLDRLLKPLAAHGATNIVLWAPYADPGFEYPGVSLQWLPMDRNATPGDILMLLESVSPDIAIANVFGEGEEHLILTYALAAERFAKQQIFPWHSPDFAEAAMDKVAFQRAATALGLPVPAGEIVGNSGDILRAIDRLGGPPVMLKEAKTQARQGIYAIPDRGALRLILQKACLQFPLVVQRMVTGEEVGMEVLSADGESCRFPVVSTGDIDFLCDPASRVRSAPRMLPPPALARMHKSVDTIEQRLRPHGPWQLDMALAGDEIFILEINGRLGGLSDLGMWSTGLDSHSVFCQLLTTSPLPQPIPAAIAMQIPIAPGAIFPQHVNDVHASILTSVPFNPLPVNSDYDRIALQSASQKAVECWVDQLDPTALRAPLTTLRRQVARAFAGLAPAI